MLVDAWYMSLVKAMLGCLNSFRARPSQVVLGPLRVVASSNSSFCMAEMGKASAMLL